MNKFKDYVEELKTMSPVIRSDVIFKGLSNLYKNLEEKLYPHLFQKSIKRGDLLNILITAEYIADSFQQKNIENLAVNIKALDKLKPLSKKKVFELKPVTDLFKFLWNHENPFIKFIITFMIVTTLSLIITFIPIFLISKILPIVVEQILSTIFVSCFGAGVLAGAGRMKFEKDNKGK